MYRDVRYKVVSFEGDVRYRTVSDICVCLS